MSTDKNTFFKKDLNSIFIYLSLNKGGNIIPDLTLKDVDKKLKDVLALSIKKVPRDKPLENQISSITKSPMFLTQLMTDPTNTIKSYGIEMDADDLKKIEKVSKAQLAHWEKVVEEMIGSTARNWCNLCS
ncbi:MAG: hypothetical protein GPJ52_00930 [Candidatus Heimdallarchaeota archaeon]|nr:hypothetical protein [Candidatus Heimdallarchaeota archaeon]